MEQHFQWYSGILPQGQGQGLNFSLLVIGILWLELGCFLQTIPSLFNLNFSNSSKILNMENSNIKQQKNPLYSVIFLPKCVVILEIKNLLLFKNGKKYKWIVLILCEMFISEDVIINEQRTKTIILCRLH